MVTSQNKLRRRLLQFAARLYQSRHRHHLQFSLIDLGMRIKGYKNSV
jgi:hypothetical protein